jgi:serine/threonine protein kinase
MAPIEAPFPDAPPTLPGYDLDGLLGVGALGRVFRARRAADGVAVTLELAETAKARAALACGAHAGALGLVHESIVRVLDVRLEADPPFLALEPTAGGDLRRLLGREAQLAPRRAAAILGDVAGALAFAHDRGVVHGDVRPENILLDASGRAKLDGFGLRVVPDDDPSKVAPPDRPAASAAPYLLPELRDGGKPTAQADIYALGVVFFETLGGRLPVGAELPSEARRDLGPHWDAIFRRCTRIDAPYDSARMLERDLRAAAARAEIRVKPVYRRGIEPDAAKESIRGASTTPAPAPAAPRFGRPVEPRPPVPSASPPARDASPVYAWDSVRSALPSSAPPAPHAPQSAPRSEADGDATAQPVEGSPAAVSDADIERARAELGGGLGSLGKLGFSSPSATYTIGLLLAFLFALFALRAPGQTLGLVAVGGFYYCSRTCAGRLLGHRALAPVPSGAPAWQKPLTLLCAALPIVAGGLVIALLRTGTHHLVLEAARVGLGFIAIVLMLEGVRLYRLSPRAQAASSWLRLAGFLLAVTVPLYACTIGLPGEPGVLLIASGVLSLLGDRWESETATRAALDLRSAMPEGLPPPGRLGADDLKRLVETARRYGMTVRGLYDAARERAPLARAAWAAIATAWTLWIGGAFLGLVLLRQDPASPWWRPIGDLLDLLP